MAEFFENRGTNLGYRNMVDDPYLNAVRKGNRPPHQRNYPFNACGMNNCCGLAATGDEVVAPVDTAAAPVDKTKIQSIKTWHYAKTGLAIIGAYVIIKYAISKMKK
jgi:hypothetical protein